MWARCLEDALRTRAELSPLGALDPAWARWAIPKPASEPSPPLLAAMLAQGPGLWACWEAEVPRAELDALLALRRARDPTCSARAWVLAPRCPLWAWFRWGLRPLPGWPQGFWWGPELCLVALGELPAPPWEG